MNNQLSEKAKVNLQRNAELRKKDSKFVNLAAGEKTILQFDPEKIKPVERDFGDGEKRQKFQYTVTEPNFPDQEKIFEVSKRTSEEIDENLNEGNTLLKIQRVGLGKETRYRIIPS
jgi:hypothetical protein